MRGDGEEAFAAQVGVAPGVRGADRAGVERRVEPLGAPVLSDLDRRAVTVIVPCTGCPKKWRAVNAARVCARSTVQVPAATEAVVVMPGFLR